MFLQISNLCTRNDSATNDVYQYCILLEELPNNEYNKLTQRFRAFAFLIGMTVEEEEEEFLGLKPPNNEIKYIIKSIELFILMSSHSFDFM